MFSVLSSREKFQENEEFENYFFPYNFYIKIAQHFITKNYITPYNAYFKIQDTWKSTQVNEIIVTVAKKSK